MTVNETLDLGSCCCCGKVNATVRNVIMLPRRAPVPGTGWGCVLCGLPQDGAVYIACDRCVKNGNPPSWVCHGMGLTKGRSSIAELSPDVFEHNLEKHDE